MPWSVVWRIAAPVVRILLLPAGAVAWFFGSGRLSVAGQCAVVASVLLWGLGRVTRRRYPSVALLTAAAAAGEPTAMRGYASMHKLNGDVDSAEQMLRSAVERGDVESMFDLGRLVEERDDVDAAEPWFRMAAERRHVVARIMFQPGNLYNRDGTASPLRQPAGTIVAPEPAPVLTLYGVRIGTVAKIAMVCQLVAGVTLAATGGPWWWALLAYALTAIAWSSWLDRAREPSTLPPLAYFGMNIAGPASAALAVWALVR